MEDDDFKDKLTVRQYAVLRQKETEKPFTGEFVDFKGKGIFACAACGVEVFSADSKFDSKTGWASFSKPIVEDAVEVKDGEVMCKKCGSHLGKRYDDGPTDLGGKRYSLNSLALTLDSQEDEDDKDEEEKGRNGTAKNIAIIAAVAIAGVAFGATGYGALVCHEARPATSAVSPVVSDDMAATTSKTGASSVPAVSVPTASVVSAGASGGSSGGSGGSSAVFAPAASLGGSSGSGQPVKDLYAFNDITWLVTPETSADGTASPNVSVSVRLVDFTKNGQPVSIMPITIASYPGPCEEIATPIQDKGEISSIQCGTTDDGKQLGIFREGDLLRVRVRDVKAGSGSSLPLQEFMTIDLTTLSG